MSPPTVLRHTISNFMSVRDCSKSLHPPGQNGSRPSPPASGTGSSAVSSGVWPGRRRGPGPRSEPPARPGRRDRRREGAADTPAAASIFCSWPSFPSVSVLAVTPWRSSPRCFFYFLPDRESLAPFSATLKRPLLGGREDRRAGAWTWGRWAGPRAPLLGSSPGVASRSKPAQVPREAALLSALVALHRSPVPAQEPPAGRWFQVRTPVQGFAGAGPHIWKQQCDHGKLSVSDRPERPGAVGPETLPRRAPRTAAA